MKLSTESECFQHSYVTTVDNQRDGMPTAHFWHDLQNYVITLLNSLPSLAAAKPREIAARLKMETFLLHV